MFSNENGKETIIEMVFNGVNIPRNSRIVSASVKFITETDKAGNPGDFDIYTTTKPYELTNTDACDFKDVSSISGLTSNVTWNITHAQDDYSLTTVDIKDIIEQRIRDETYTPGHDTSSMSYLVLFLRSKALSVQGSSEAVVYSGDSADTSKRPSMSVRYKLPSK